MAAVQQNGEGGRIDVAFEDNIAVITMRRGQNRFNQQCLDQINSALDKVLENQDVKALVTTGERRFYSNGLDADWLAYIGSKDLDSLKQFTSEKGFGQLNVRLLTFPIPTIALVNGHAFAAGAVFVALHDHVIMQTERGWWSLNEVHLKMRLSDFVNELMKSKLPLGETFQNAVLLGKRFTGHEAREAGIVNEICPSNDLMHRARAWVARTVPVNGFDREHFETMKRDVYKKLLNCAKVEGQFDQFTRSNI